jgi:transposase-like protein
MDPFILPRRFNLAGHIIDELTQEAERATRRTLRQWRRHFRERRGATLRPGPGTPLWNELVRQAAPLLKKRGSKADLARLLGLPRQRLQDCLKAQTACLDAERTLLLMCWIAARQQGRAFLL